MQVQVAYEIHKWIILLLHTEIRLEVLSEASNGRLSSLLFLYLRLFFGFNHWIPRLGELSLSAIPRNYARNTFIQIWIDFFWYVEDIVGRWTSLQKILFLKKNIYYIIRIVKFLEDRWVLLPLLISAEMELLGETGKHCLPNEITEKLQNEIDTKFKLSVRSCGFLSAFLLAQRQK